MQFDFPVGKHRFTTAEFDRKKAEYVAKHGYVMSIPGFSDIFKIGLDYKPTEREVELYRKKDITALGFDKYDQIARIMKKKKESFMRMMSSPNPTWLNNIGTTMTFLDDINDAAGTLSFVCRSMARLVPKALARYFLGPAGWALTIADIVGLAMTIARAPINAVMSKSRLNASLEMNPFSKNAKVFRAKRLRKIKPTKGEVIELLQVTNSMFGVGLSLGPIVGAFLEAFSGPVRVLQGKKVTVKWPIPDFSYFERVAMTSITAADALSFGDDELTWEDHCKTYLVAEMATHVLYPIFEEYHPIDQIEGIQNIIPTPPKPTDPLTKLLFDEEGVDPNTHIGFPGAEDTDGSASELMDTTSTYGALSFKKFCQKNSGTYLGLVGMQAVNNFTLNSLALWEGPEQVLSDVSPVLKACFKIIEHGSEMPKSTFKLQYETFGQTVIDLENKGYEVTWDVIKDFICPRLGITLQPRYIIIGGDRSLSRPFPGAPWPETLGWLAQ